MLIGLDRETVGIQAEHDLADLLEIGERGAGETLACGSGACAAVVAGRLQERLSARVKVLLNGGELVVSWDGEGQPVLMTGPATTVYQGRIEL